MNRVYKVIWSKAKHCYVVTSEIARSVTKSASSARSAGRKGAAVLAMAALLFTAGGVLGEAANVTGITVNKKGNVITATKDDKSTDIIKINNVAHAKEADYATAATKATSDGNGHVIENTYIKNVDARVGADGEYVKVANTVGKIYPPWIQIYPPWISRSKLKQLLVKLPTQKKQLLVKLLIRNFRRL